MNEMSADATDLARTMDPATPRRRPSASSYDLHGETRVRLPSDRFTAHRQQTLTRGEYLAAMARADGVTP